ncbi:MAG: carboxypeptidase regulatory-like domain-containing protein, partial [Planctomycetota bacterium]
MSPARAKFVSLMLTGLCTAATGRAADPSPETTSQPSTKPAQLPVVEGQVFDHIGAGIRGVQVRVFVLSDGGRKGVGSATTDPMGEFKVHSTELVRGKLLVTFLKPGFQPAEVEVESVPDESPPFVDYRLEGALDLKGLVRDRLKDVPVAGARVVVQAAYHERSATTDDSGRFEIKGLSPCRAQITIEAEGFARLRTKFELEIEEETEHAESKPHLTIKAETTATPEGEIVFLLKPERVIRLTVTDADGQPIPKVVVEAVVEAEDDFRTGVTDDTGRLTLRGLSIDAAQVAFRLTHPGYVSSAAFDRAADLPPDQTESSHTFVMASAATITGKVTNTAGQPLGSARLTVGCSVDEIAATAWSEFDGTFTLSGVPAGEPVVTVHLAEHAPRLFVLAADPEKPTTLEVVLSPAAQVGGRVVDPEGKPVSGAHVMAVRWRGYNTLALQAMTDADGRFTMPDAPADEFTVRVSARGFKPLANQSVQGGRTDLRFQFTEVQTQADSPTAARLQPGQQAPAFDATTLDGRKIKLADFKGKYLFLDFWATWCGPCRTELPNVRGLAEAARGKPLVIVSVSLDKADAAESLKKFVAVNKMAWTHIFDGKAWDSPLCKLFEVTGVPAMFLIDENGQILRVGLRGQQLREVTMGEL